MKRGAPAVAVVVVVLFLAAHHALLHEAAADFAYALAALAGLGALCLLAAGAGHLRSVRRPRPAETRARVVTARPAAPRPASQTPAGRCSAGCGEPATRLFDKWPVCDECGGRLDVSAGQFAADRDEPAAPAVAVTVPEVRQWAFGPDGEPLPDGESMLGYLDMSEYEKDVSS